MKHQKATARTLLFMRTQTAEAFEISSFLPKHANAMSGWANPNSVLCQSHSVSDRNKVKSGSH